jgi:hypothetical protein
MHLANAHTNSAGADLVAILASYWWVFLLCGGAILEWVGERFDMGLSAIRRGSRLRYKRRLALKKLELQIAQARTQPASAVAAVDRKPGPCAHRGAKQIRTMDGVLVGWLCPREGCDERLPADWAVAAEDL